MTTPTTPRRMLASSAVHEMSEPDCWRSLALSDLGRLAVVGPDGVDIFPVNYLAAGGAVVFRSAPGAKLAMLAGGADVAFEADGVEEPDRWSVVIHGRAQRLDADDEILASGILDLHPDAPREMNNFVRITPRRISGRRFRGDDRA